MTFAKSNSRARAKERVFHIKKNLHFINSLAYQARQDLRRRDYDHDHAFRKSTLRVDQQHRASFDRSCVGGRAVDPCVDYSTSLARLFRGPRKVAWFCNVDALNPYDLARTIPVRPIRQRSATSAADYAAWNWLSRFARLVPCVLPVCSLLLSSLSSDPIRSAVFSRVTIAAIVGNQSCLDLPRSGNGALVEFCQVSFESSPFGPNSAQVSTTDA